MLNDQERLSDGVIVLDWIRNEDIVSLHEMLSDEYLCDKAGLSVSTSINQTINFAIEGLESAKGRQQYFYGIFKDEELVGLINFFNLDYIERSGEYGYFISSNHTRQGYMLRAVKLLTNYLLEKTEIERVNIYIDTTNKASLGLVKKLDLRAQGSNLEQDLQNRFVSMEKYSITKRLK